MESQNLLLGVLDFLPNQKTEDLKQRIQSVPTDGNSDGSSCGEGSLNFLECLGDFFELIRTEEQLKSGDGKTACDAFRQNVSCNKNSTFHSLRETLLCEPVENVGASDGLTAVTDEQIGVECCRANAARKVFAHAC